MYYEVIHRCVVSHKFYDGLPAASDCAQSIEMYCHTWKYLRGKYFWSGSGLYLHASPGKEYTDSLSFVSFICECSYDLDRVENPNTQRISERHLWHYMPVHFCLGEYLHGCSRMCAREVFFLAQQSEVIIW